MKLMKGGFTFKVQEDICNMKFDNWDLPAIVNVFPRNPFELQSFDNISLQGHLEVVVHGFSPMSSIECNVAFTVLLTLLYFWGRKLDD